MPPLNPQFKALSEASRSKTLIMGVLNVTPDSFSDGGRYLDPQKALEHVSQMLQEGADLIDVGGESTRPGAEPVSEEEELRRILPVAEGLKSKYPDFPWAIDTTKAKVAAAALELGACMVNDVSALSQDPEMPRLVAARGCGAVLMHRRAKPADSKWSPEEKSKGEAGLVVADIRKALTQRASSLLLEGLQKQQFWIDPGFGFGKSVDENLALIAGLPEFLSAGYPVLLGPSRKSSLGAVLGGLAENERFEATAAAVAVAAFQGVSCVRVHDVLAMSRVVRLAQALRQAGPKAQAPETPKPLHPFRASEEF